MKPCKGHRHRPLAHHTGSDHRKTPNPVGVLQQARGPAGILLIFLVGRVGHLYLFQSQEQEMIDDTGLSQTLQSYYMTYLVLDWLRAEILDC